MIMNEWKKEKRKEGQKTKIILRRWQRTNEFQRENNFNVHVHRTSIDKIDQEKADCKFVFP